MAITYPVSYTSCSLMMTLPEIGSNSTITSQHLLTFAGMAESLINAKISRQYALPLTVDVPILQTIATDLAIYNTLTGRLYTAERMKSSAWPERYKQAMDILKEISNGTLQLLDSSGSIVAARTDINEVWSDKMDYIPTFHEGNITDSIQDEDKIDNELDRRDL